LRFGFRLHWFDELLCVSYFVLIRSRLHLLVSCFFIVDLLYILLHQFGLTVFFICSYCYVISQTIDFKFNVYRVQQFEDLNW
jgi:hypothetical protein